MKFEETLANSLAPEWKAQYLVYKKLKKLIYYYRNSLIDKQSTQYEDNLLIAENNFYELITSELDKINDFYIEKLAEAKRKFGELTRELRVLKRFGEEYLEYKDGKLGQLSNINDMDVPLELTQPAKKLNFKKKLRSLGYFFTEFYLSVVILLNYQRLNYTGYRKILKKHDKEWYITSGKEFFITRINHSTFHNDNKAQDILNEIEDIYIKEFANGDRSKGMNDLRVPPLDERDSKMNFPSFTIGFCFSAIIIMVTIIILKCIYNPPNDGEKIFRMFRGQLIISFFVVLISFNVYVWRHCGVNHVLIFEINPRHHIGFTETFAIGMIFVLIVLICGCGYVFHKDLNFPTISFPLTSFFSITLLMLNPLGIFYRSSRFFFLKALFNCLVAGFVYVRFVDFWLGDQMTSLIGPFKDLHCMACSILLYNNQHSEKCATPNISTMYIVASTPFYIRGAQCLRRYINTRDNVHLANMIKYFTCVIVQILTAIYYICVDNKKYYFMVLIPKFLSTTYLTIWDICVDWSLIVYSRRRGKFKWRENRIYKKNYLYVISCIFDIFIRYLWIITEFDFKPKIIPPIYTETALQLLDATRRFVWNFYRVENEHLNNIGKYRTVRDISIKPLIKQNLESLE